MCVVYERKMRENTYGIRHVQRGCVFIGKSMTGPQEGNNPPSSWHTRGSTPYNGIEVEHLNGIEGPRANCVWCGTLLGKLPVKMKIYLKMKMKMEMCVKMKVKIRVLYHFSDTHTPGAHVFIVA